MMEFRSQGYSNARIAEILGCSYQTVLKYIGKQDGKPSCRQVKLVKRSGEPVSNPVLTPEQYEACKRHIEMKKAEAEPPAQGLPDSRLETISIIATLRGKAGTYVVDMENKTVSFQDAGFTIGFGQLEALLGDIQALRETVHT